MASDQEAVQVSSSAIRGLSPEEHGDMLMYQQQYQAAIDAYRSIPAPSAAVWNKIGVSYHHLFALGEAISAYQRALAIDPHYAAAFNNLGAAFFAQKNFKKSERLYKKAIKLTPNAPTFQLNLGAVYFAERKLQKGMEAYRAAFSIDPNAFGDHAPHMIPEPTSATERANSDYCVAALFAQAGKNDRAIEYLRKAIDEGFSDYKQLTEDKNFAALRHTEEYASLMKNEWQR
jgi:tetratricopeptide (TPR) repeat protein